MPNRFDKIPCRKVNDADFTKTLPRHLVEQEGYLKRAGMVVIEQPKKAPVDNKPKGEVIDVSKVETKESEGTEEQMDQVDTLEGLEAEVKVDGEIIEPEKVEAPTEMTLEEAREAHLEKFGKKPRANAKLETILTKLEE